MSANPTTDLASLLSADVTVPKHVVFRSFPAETVVLNLTTGTYHGLNATAGRMLEAIDRENSIPAAAAAVAAEYGEAQATVEADMCDLCRLLLDRGLVEVDDRPDR